MTLANPVRLEPAGFATRRIIALAGLPGAGKTRLAQVIAPVLGARIVSRDDIRATYFRELPLEAGKLKAFDAMMALIDGSRGRAVSFVLDGLPFSCPDQVLRVNRAGAAGDAAIDWLWLDVPVNIARKRVAGQGPDHSAPDRNVDLVNQVAARFTPPPRATRIDASQPFGQVYRAAMAALL